MPSDDKPITIHHLIHHTSGLPEYMPLLARAGWRADAPFGNQDVLEIVARERRLNFEPGEQFAYSNTGYTLLALIVERAARIGFSEFADARTFSPLHMKDTHFNLKVISQMPESMDCRVQNRPQPWSRPRSQARGHRRLPTVDARAPGSLASRALTA